MDGGGLYSSPVFANGVLYLAARTGLFAIAADRSRPDPKRTGGYWPQWRGGERANVSTETGLLQEARLRSAAPMAAAGAR
jgi:hypothetical protein